MTSRTAPPVRALPPVSRTSADRGVGRGPVGAARDEDDRGATFRPDIEGLRAVAVLAVVLFHAGVPFLPGGFVGVDVFFVISGFLITGMLWREVRSTGGVRLGRFFGARARRLLPAGSVVLLTTAAASAWLLPPLEARSVLGDAVASALYAGNYRLALRDTDYLAADTAPSPFQHFWSLGVEEQFYVLWPVLLILTAWAVRRFSRRAGVPSALPYVAVLAVVAAGSFVTSLAWTASSPSWAYFSLPSRAWELAVGGLVALTLPAWQRLPRAAAAGLGWTGMGMVAVGCLVLGESTAYPGTAALLPVLGTALVIAGGASQPRAGVGTVLSLPPMRFIGRVSYSWYLWHWPALLLAPHLVGGELEPVGRLSTAVVALGLAMLTVALIENPVRYAAALRRSTPRSLLLGASATALGAVVGLVLMTAVPAPVGQGAAAEKVALGVPEVQSGSAQAEAAATPVDPAEAELKALTAQVQAAVAASVGLTEVPSNLTPALSEAKADVPRIFTNGCFLTWTATEQPLCEWGDPAAAVDIALVGDSHAAQWMPAFQPVAEERGWHLRMAAKTTCPLLDLPITSPYLERAYGECVSWREQLVGELKADPPSVVLLGMGRRYGDDFGFTSYDVAWVDSLGRMTAELEAAGSQVIVLGGVPDPHATVPTCLSSNLSSVPACTPARAEAVNAAGVEAERAATEAAGGTYADLTELFCTDAVCPVIIGGTLVFRDDNHLTFTYADFLRPVMGALVARELSAS
jgi:peptidoglycan/LPS O-acetylase OafA/YrhL